MVKVRIQILAGENPGKSYGPISVAQNIWKSEGGLGAFYKGIDSALMRQAIYTTARFGIFLNLSDYFKRKNNGANLSLFQKAQASLTAGGLGSFVGTPADLILIRMQADSMLPQDQKRGYKSFFDAARRIPKEEGVTALWSGGVPTITRAMALNLGMFATNEQAKEQLTKLMPENKRACSLLAAGLAGAAAATLSLPFDNAKTKMQKMKPGADGKMPYANIFDCMAKSAAASGVTGLWVGLPTYIVRIAPHVMISLTVAEFLRGALLS